MKEIDIEEFKRKMEDIDQHMIELGVITDVRKQSLHEFYKRVTKEIDTLLTFWLLQNERAGINKRPSEVFPNIFSWLHQNQASQSPMSLGCIYHGCPNEISGWFCTTEHAVYDYLNAFGLGNLLDIVMKWSDAQWNG